MATTSKTLTEALNELLKNLEKSNTVIISGLSKQLAENLPLNCKIYLPKGKKLEKPALTRQFPSYLYSATYALVDDEEQKRGA